MIEKTTKIRCDVCGNWDPQAMSKGGTTVERLRAAAAAIGWRVFQRKDYCWRPGCRSKFDEAVVKAEHDRQRVRGADEQ